VSALQGIDIPDRSAAAVMPSDLTSPGAPAIGGETFERLAEPLRRELRLHCYRMLGSLHEAEDATQETFIRAWRGFGRFDGRGPFRAWLYRIATNVCLDALAGRRRLRRMLPDQREAVSTRVPALAGIRPPPGDVAWLEPYPDCFIEHIADDAPNPEARFSARESVQLAFVAVIQLLPPRQRAMLLLSDVLGWPVAEIAALLDCSVAAVNSGLQRARATFAANDHRPPATTLNRGQQQLLGRYITAWESFDLDAFVALLREDARLVMPPFPEWYVGRAAIGAFHRNVWAPFAGFRMVETGANGQPALALYGRRSAGDPWEGHSLHVLTVEGDAIAAITLFAPPLGPRFFEAFGLPARLPAG
jgi:RNA polymerase sigma-70 factor (ECF subfamily)